MFDNQLIALVINTIIAQETIAGIPGTPIKSAFQPTLQGVNNQPTAYMYKIGDRRVGSPNRSDVWSVPCSSMIHTELQQYESTFQISALSTQNPAAPGLTASDLLNQIAYILQSSVTIATLEAQGVGIERVMDVRNPYFLDDRYQNEANPSLDFVLTHKQIVYSTTPIIETTELQIIPI